jgi:hypothetical protein
MVEQLLLEAEQSEEARRWLEQGIGLACSRGDHKPIGEIGDALGQAQS